MDELEIKTLYKIAHLFSIRKGLQTSPFVVRVRHPLGEVNLQLLFEIDQKIIPLNNV